MNPIHVACAFDKAMAFPALIVAASIKQNMRPGRRVIFHAAVTDKRALATCAAGRLLNSKFFEFRSFLVRRSDVIDIDLSKSWMSLWATAVRFSVPDFAGGSERIIYLDSDVIVHKPLDELFDMDMGGHAIAACPDFCMTIFARHPKAYPPLQRSLRLQYESNSYFNSGVLLFDCLKWTSNRYFDTCKTLAATTEPSFFGDQDILNIAFQSNYQKLDPRWNAFAYTPETSISDPEAAAISLANADPWITHFTGPTKPWLFKQATPAAERFWTIAFASPFRSYAYVLWYRGRRWRSLNVVPRRLTRKIAELVLTTSRGIGSIERVLRTTELFSNRLWQFGETLYQRSL